MNNTPVFICNKNVSKKIRELTEANHNLVVAESMPQITEDIIRPNDIADKISSSMSLPSHLLGDRGGNRGKGGKIKYRRSKP